MKEPQLEPTKTEEGKAPKESDYNRGEESPVTPFEKALLDLKKIMEEGPGPDCVSNQLLRDFVYDELDPVEREAVADHLKKCDRCNLIEQVMDSNRAVWDLGFKQQIDWESHPPDLKLKTYLTGKIKKTQLNQIEQHLESCLQCRGKVEAFRVEEEVWEKKLDVNPDIALAEALGEKGIKKISKIISKL